MKLYIDPTGGMAGDMFSACLISLGIPFYHLSKPMLFAAEKLGKANIDRGYSPDNATILNIKLEFNSDHLSKNRGEKILKETFQKFPLEYKYQQLGLDIFKILFKAEEKAHIKYDIVVGHHHHHQPVLHEAQDIIIDILGVCFGFQYLNIKTSIIQLKPISLGGGTINFSHGKFSIPAPATKIMIDDYHLITKKGPVNFELFTPTGAAILSALAPHYQELKLKDLSILKEGHSRGTKKLDIPPLKLFLAK